MRRLLDSMLQSLKAETWYQLSGQVLDSVAMGRVSLEILNPGPQPIYNEDGSLCVMLDGEVYNPQYQSQRQDLIRRGHVLQTESDAELLLHLYEDCGENFVQGINGTFNAVLWDGPQRKLVIANDCFGSRPLYYSTQARFCFATEIKALLQQSDFERKVNEEAAIEFFALRHILGDKTLFADIRILPPATVLTYQDEQVTLASHWMPAFEQEPGTLQEHAERLVVLLRQAVDRCMSREQSVGLLLSGGLDSRLLVGLVDRRHFPINTFTRGVPGCDDARLAQMVADRVGAQHHFMETAPDFLIHRARRGVWLTDGLMTCTDFYELSTIEQLKQHVNVVCFGIPAGPLGGLGLSPALFDLDDGQLASRIYSMRTSFSDSWQSALFSDHFYRNIKGVVLRNLQQLLHDMPSTPSHIKAQLYFLRCYGPRSALHGPVLTRNMVETVFPFADADLLDYTCRVPGRFRMNRVMEIEMFKRACPELAEIPWQFSGLPVSTSTPKRVRFQRALYRARKELSWKTHGLFPLPERREQVNWPHWFRTVLRPWLEDILLSERTLARDYFRRDGVRQLVQEHMTGQCDRSVVFGRLLTFELWNRLFVDGEAL